MAPDGVRRAVVRPLLLMCFVVVSRAAADGAAAAAAAIVALAPEARAFAHPSTAADACAASLGDKVLQRDRHDAVVRCVSRACRAAAGGGASVRADAPVHETVKAAVRNANRRPDIIVDQDQTQTFVEVTVRRGVAADAALLDRAIAEKREKYADLPGRVVVVAVDALTGEMLPRGEASRALIGQGLIADGAAPALERDVRRAVVERGARLLKNIRRPRRRAGAAPRGTRRERRRFLLERDVEAGPPV